MAATIVLRPSAVEVEPGGEAVVEATVRNTSSVVDEFTLEVLGDPGAWASVDPPALRLLPDTEETTEIRFSPPRVGSISPGPAPFGVKVLPKEDSDGTAVEEGTLEIQPFSDLSLEIIPHTSRGRMSAKHELYVDNRGNQRLNVPMYAADPDDNLDLRLSPPTAVAEPGSATRIKVQARPRDKFFRGQPKTHPFQVIGEPEGQEAVAGDATMLQEALLPKWLLPALLVLGALIALWFLALKPTIESTAKDAVEEPIAALEERVGGVEQGTGGDGGTGTGTATATGTGTDVRDSRSTLRDGRLEANGTSTFDFPVASGKRLEITDLVLQNPRGDFGAMRLLRDPTPDAPGDEDTILEVRLENFRDLDYHFVTPVVVSAGQSLLLDVDCANRAQQPPVDRDCSGAVQFSGVLVQP